MLDLRRQFGRTYRIALDESATLEGQTREERLWLYQIPCIRGHIFVQGRDTLGAYCDKGPTIKRLAALPYVKPLQRGDREASFSFPPEHLPEVAKLLGARRVRRLSEEHKQKLAESNEGHRFKPRFPEQS